MVCAAFLKLSINSIKSSAHPLAFSAMLSAKSTMSSLKKLVVFSPATVRMSLASSTTEKYVEVFPPGI
jgi:hypothetical protein